MPSLTDTLETIVRDAIAGALGDDFAQTDPALMPVNNPEFGDFQANFAMALAKKLGKKPRDVAQPVADAIETGPVVGRVEVAGPGFINLHVTGAALSSAAADMLNDKDLGVAPADPPQTVVIDYSGPNVAKEMHIGHLRSTAIGDAIARVLGFLGHHVIRHNHLGDWGTQFGMLVEHLIESFPEDRLIAEDFSIGDLDEFYRQAKRKFDADPDFAQRSRQRVVKLQGGDPESNQLWEALRIESLEHFDHVYDRLDVLLDDDDVRPESAYNDMLPDVVASLDKAGLLKESQGAAVVYPEGFTGKDGEAMPMIVRKGDGGYLYSTTDLAAARYRIDELHADRVIYVTDARQSQHFAMVFQVVRQAGWAPPEVKLEHVPFGTILGKDHKPFKTREGGTVKLADVLDEAVQRAERVITEKNPDLPPDERRRTAEVIGIGAVKYADLSNDRIKDYVFDWDRMLALEGNTAPYLINAYVRIQSIFRKANANKSEIRNTKFEIREPTERALVLKLIQYPGVIRAVADSLEPHRLCTFLYELASAYHQFYEHCPVLKAPDDATRQSRLALCDLVARTLKQGLSLLGIGSVEQM